MRRSRLSADVRSERLVQRRERGSQACTEEALALFEMAVASLRRDEGLSRAAAVRRLLASRRAGRRSSRVAGP